MTLLSPPPGGLVRGGEEGGGEDVSQILTYIAHRPVGAAVSDNGISIIGDRIVI